ncbi:heterokaryon incompatibility [Fusarium albosuccineum]|uniref:Heterokaryon incompatibility n=1 Tax=Fusarium albosuccineum TaxID=1237068 RepID=A0A8H4LM92_9HYPO|nr:heterokaryon incompatibility [Fusarium albosuccineum]
MTPHQNLDPNNKGSRYLDKVTPWKGMAVNEVDEVRAAIEDGLDPNILWSENDLVIPAPKSGCVIPPYVEDSETWPHHNTPLHRAVRFSDFESAQLLLRHGADINLCNSIGRTALHEVVWNHDHDAIRFLLAHNPDVNKKTIAACVRYEDDERDMHGSEGDLCVLRALSTSDLTSLRLLAEAGAELHPASQGPWTALDLALLSEDRQIVEYLRTRKIELPARLPALETWTENTHRDASRDLLAFSSKGDILPPGELYLAYCYALANIQGHLAKCDSEALIQAFFKALQENAGQTQHRTGRKMCASCEDFQSGVKGVDEKQTEYKVTLYQSRQDLIDSAARGCPLCRIIAIAFDYEEGRLGSNSKSSDQQVTQDKDTAQPILLWVDIDPPKKLSMCYLWASWGDLRLHVDLDRVDDDPIIRALEDEKEPDTSTGSTSAMEMAKIWLHTCKDDGSHVKCQEACRSRQNTSALPRRLLRVGGPDDNPRLVEAQGNRLPYCALSYCWGTKDFFTTTRANLLQNMEDIPRESFPTIMQDAMSVTRSLGYDHIWIDALGIVQDDEKTGLMKHRSWALFTPTLNLPSPRLWQATATRVSSNLDLSGLSWAVFAEWAQEHLCIHGPVHSRGWTLQEQLLSTRILYFGDGILHWEYLHDYRVEADPGGDNRRGYNYRADLAKRSETKQAVQGALS